jgi:uncharacterized protein
MAAVFEWDPLKDEENQRKHGVSFAEAQLAFLDPGCVIAEDAAHSIDEQRFYCFGMVDAQVLTVRFTYRALVIRIIGAGYWRIGRRIYEAKQGIHGRADRPDSDH